jgi:hypothetical protein
MRPPPPSTAPETTTNDTKDADSQRKPNDTRLSINHQHILQRIRLFFLPAGILHVLLRLSLVPPRPRQEHYAGPITQQVWTLPSALSQA